MPLQTILLFTGSYFLFFALLLLAKKRGANRITTANSHLVSSPLLLWLHLAGVLLFGLLPFCFSGGLLFSFFYISTGRPAPTMICVFLFLVTLWLAPRLAQKQGQKFSSEAWVASPTPLFLGLYFFLRLLFIAAYEVWFRGLLLQESIAVLGTLWAVVLNTGFYTLLHLVNDKREWLLCIPFGTLLCILCIWQQAVWPAVFIHLALTMGYELTLVKKHILNTHFYAHPRHRRIGLYRS
ncbi:CPBP family intramembrane metalloprotease [Flavisolibacter sp. BT320]|nr:CPBP family intramembrane metalloprotease [Flavisolibacter longurius]